MSKIDEIRKAMVDAMKAKDKERKDTLSMLLAALKNKAIDKRADLTDLIEDYKKRLAVLEEFAPKMMDADEIKAIISGVLADLGINAPTAKDKGRIMKELMPKVKGKADGKLVNEIVGSFMS